MARYMSTVTDRGAEVQTQLLALGLPLRIVRAECGDGVASVSPNTITALVSPLPVDTYVGEKEYIVATPSYMRLSVQVSNLGLAAPVWIREIIVYALDADNNEFAYAYAWIVGADSDNILPAALDPGDTIPDTYHIHDLAIVITNQEYSAVRVEVGVGSMVTYGQMVAYAAKLVHTHTAVQIFDSNGFTVEELLRNHEYEIQAIKEQLDTGFVGTSVTWTFDPDQINQWAGYDGTGLPEGILDTVQHRLYL